jgi:hypothetical protein
VTGIAVQAMYAIWAYLDSAPRETLDTLASGFVTTLLVGVGLLGIVPAALLWRPASRRAGAKVALGLGIGMCLLVFWIPAGVFLLAAGAAAWPRRQPPGMPA